MARTRKSERLKKAENKALNEGGLDYIMETHETPDFIEVIGSMGGDPIRYRIYDDGRMYEK